MKKSIELYSGILLTLEEFGEKDENVILRDIGHSCYFDEDTIEEILENKEHKITFGITYGDGMDEWNDDIGNNFDNISYKLIDELMRYLKDKKRVKPSITTNFDGYEVLECSYGVNYEYKELKNLTWFDLTKEEQKVMLENVFKIESAYDDENAIVEFVSGIEIEVDRKSTIDNIIFLKNSYFY